MADWRAAGAAPREHGRWRHTPRTARMPAARGSLGLPRCAISRQGGEMSKMTKTPYPTPKAPALGGCRRIILSHSRWTDVEFGFLVLEVERDVVGQPGHREKRYHYTEPETNNTKDAIEVKVPVYWLPFLRAFCHTHPTNG